MKLLNAFAVFVLVVASQVCNPEPVFAQSTPDPGLAGTFAVSKDTFDLGNLAYKPDSFPNFVELRGSVHYPTSLIGGPFPVLVLLHGRHSTVYRTSSPGTTGLTWPPPTGYQSITSFEGYDYFAKLMASHGYIVISVSCNAINAADNALADRGMNARGQLMQKHLDLWNGYNTTGGAPFGSKFVGKLDMKRIGTMGHSRGGEGVIFHALLNKSLGSPYGIKAVVTLAPVDFSRKVMNHIPLLNIAPYCDGDVTGLSGVHFYDDARYNDTADIAPKHSILMMGANHNFYNTVWTPGSYIAGTSDDWDGGFGSGVDAFCASKKTGNGRLDTSKQKAAFSTYSAAFFRQYVGGDTSFAPILEVEDIYPPLSSKLDTTQVYVSYHPAKTKRKDINRADTVANETINNLSGAVTQAGLVSALICGGGLTMPTCNISTFTPKEPHRGTTTQKGLANASLRWNDTTDYYENEIPDANKNATRYKSLLFRAALNYKETTPVGRDLDFTVQLEDSNGKKSGVKVSEVSGALFYQPGNTNGVLPKIMFNSVRIPLSKFRGVNQTKLKAVRFLFNESDSGSVLISDLTFNGIETKPCGMVNAFFKDSIGKAYYVAFKDSTKINTDDSVVYLWKFGDALSGTKDTSSFHSPTHIFSTSGLFNVCLYVSAYRYNGLVCRDTFCKSVSLALNTINEQTLSAISISPNPANTFFIINGVAATDKIELHNLCGQTVLSTSAGNGTVTIPAILPSGIYFVHVQTGAGMVVKKIMIAR